MEISELKELFVKEYGESKERLRVFSAAGRVNLIGEHIDYCGGKVFPAALNLRTAVAARKNGTDKIRLRATTIDEKVTLDINSLEKYKDLKWGAYQAGVAYVMQNAGYKIEGLDLLYDTDVPFGSGLSSSASIEVATALTLAVFSEEAGVKKADRVELAVLSQKAENEYNGVSCGIMDQFASSLGKENCAILLDCKTLQYEYVPLELKQYALVIANCNKPRSLIESKYNERCAECEQALALLKSRLPGINCLADVTEEQFQEHSQILKGKIRDRAAHVVGECARVIKSAEALKYGDLMEFGRLLNLSHYSLRDLYEVTGKELDALTRLERSHPACIGARMTGAGFGGCSVALVEKTSVDKFIAEVNAAYEKEIGHSASFYSTSVSYGAKEIG